MKKINNTNVKDGSQLCAAPLNPTIHLTRLRQVAVKGAWPLALALAWLGIVATLHAQTTIVWQENWESPNVQDNWYSDTGIWKIGVPTYGPSTNSLGWRAHQGTNCATTGLNGNYPDGRQDRLFYGGPDGLGVLIPNASDNPRLRLWHWWSFGYYDFGQVQVSTNNGVSWQALSGFYGDDDVNNIFDSSGQWSQAWLDLRPYAGKTVMLGFYFESHSGSVSSGWYVDDMAIVTGPEPGLALPEGFERGWGGWKAQYAGGLATDFAIWEIGKPTSGPGAAHTGTNCAATVLGGNYPDDRRSRLVSPAFTVPLVSLNPRLRFWHWWSFNYYDFGQVQISTNNGVSWQALSGFYGDDDVNNIFTSGQWSQAWLDLRAYAGKTVMLGFYFESHAGSVSSGWYVDDMSIETGPEPELTLPEGFESGWGGWKAQYAGGFATDFAIWEIGKPTSGPGAAHAGTNCAGTILAGNYPDDRRSRLVSPAFAVPLANLNPRLRFWHWWNFNYHDFGQVQISTNNGVSWQALAGMYGDDDVNHIYDSSGQWSQAWLDLTPFAGKTVMLGFYFESHAGSVSSGWYVDDMSIETGPEPGLALPEGFESGWGGWKAQYAGGFATDFAIWEIGKPTSGPGAAHTGTNCAATILGGNYPDDRRSRLVSPAFTVPLASLNPRLRFWHWWSFSSYDFGQLQISTNNGATWDNLSSQYTTSSGGWTYAPPISLSAYAGKTVLLGFYFESYGGGNVSSGWYVDDITILANGYTPMITAQPTNQTVIAGQPAAFTVEVSPLSSLPLSYQWWFNNTLLQDATNATLSITAAQPIHAGGYSVVVTNLYGAATSSPPATLTVLVRPSITNLTMQPSSPVYEGTNVTFCVAATGTPPLSYQWRWNGAAISGATQSCYTVANVQIVQAGAYSVAVSNVAGGLVSSDLMLAVLPDPSWHTNNVGGTGEGSYCVNNGIFTVNGSGEDIEGTEDAFFFVHKPLSGDGQMVARMLDLVSTNAGAEAGIMLRDGTNSGARHVFLALDSVGHVLLRRRLVENDYSLDNAAHGTNWTWLRLMRMGNTFAGHASTNGVDWSLIWWTTLVNMPTDLEAGLAVTAHKNKAMATAQFDNVTPGGLTPLPGVWPQPGPLIYLGGESGGQAEFQRVGGFKALVGGAVGDRYTVKWSANLQAPLAAWSPLATVTNQWGVVEFLDPQALVNPNRFYRVQRISP